jgi:hypothetical protein
MGLERGPLSLMSTTDELLGRNSSDSGLENREYGHGDPLPWPRDTLYPQRLTLTSPTCGSRSVGIVRLRTKTTEFVFCFVFEVLFCNLSGGREKTVKTVHHDSLSPGRGLYPGPRVWSRGATDSTAMFRKFVWILITDCLSS